MVTSRHEPYPPGNKINEAAAAMLGQAMKVWMGESMPRHQARHEPLVS